MSRRRILGNGGPVPSLSVKLPPYVIAKRRAEGYAFYFQVPKRLRPEGWPGAARLPKDEKSRTGLGDAIELGKVAKDADELYKRLQSEREGGPDNLRAHTLPWLIQSFEQATKDKNRSKKTIRGYQYGARQVLAWSKESGHPLVSLIERPGVLQFLATMDRNPSKRRFVGSYLRSLMRHAMDRGLRTDNPAIELDLETPEAKIHIWTAGELVGMIAAADALGLEGVGTAILIAHDTGTRPGDVLKLQRHRTYDPKDGTFRFHQGKTGEWVINPATARLRARLAKQPEMQVMLVLNPRTRRAYNERVFQRDFTRVRNRIGLPGLQFRHLRHTCVVNHKRAGCDKYDIASKTGHSVKSVDEMLDRHYLPHDSEVATNATAKFEAYLSRKV